MITKSYLKYLLIIASILSSIGVLGQGNEGGKPADTPAKYDMLDSLIAISIILFILSVIVEKITQLIRKYAPFIKPHYPKPIRNTAGVFWRNINKKQTGVTPERDKRVEREVGTLSFVIGALIVIAFKVDLFRMLTEADPRNVLFWKDSKGLGTTIDILLFILSLALTAFFLTFGSKFFHDLLDTLFQVKSMKKKLTDDNTYKAETIQQFDEYIEKGYTELIETAIQQNRDCFVGPLVVGPPMHGRMMKDGRLVDCIDVHVSGTDRGIIPVAVQAKLEKGQVINVPVQVIFEVAKPKALAAQGDTIGSQLSPNFKGTICCKLRRNSDNRVALLTCSHVITAGSAKNHFGTITPEIAANFSENASGNFFWAICDNQLDVGLMDPGQVAFEYKFRPGKERVLTPSDMSATKVKVVRQGDRGVASGEVVNHRARRPIAIIYKEGEFSLQDLIILGKAINEGGEQRRFVSLTSEGDSGACVYDENNCPIGMIVAGNSQFSYAIPIIDILNKANASIIT